MPTEHRDVDVDGQLRAFAVALEAHTAEPIRPGPRPVDDGRGDRVVVEPVRTPLRPDRRRWLLPAVAAVVAAVALVASLVVLSDNTAPSDTPTPTTTPTTTPPTTTPEDVAEEPSPAGAAVVETFFGAYNDGDTDAVLALLADDVVVTEQYGGASPNPDDDPFPNPDQQLAWKHAQGENITEPICVVAAEEPDTGSALRCEYTTLDAFVQAVDGSPIPTRALFTIVDGEIIELHQGYGNPDYSALASQFRRWIEQNHPDVWDALFADWASRDEAVEQGQLRADWAQRWARYLDDNACTPTQTCTPPEAITDAAASVDTTLTLTQIGDWTRIDGLDISGVVSDGTGFFAPRGTELLRSVDGVTWEEYTEPNPLFADLPEAVRVAERSFFAEGPTAAVRDGRLVLVEDAGNSVIVHIVDPDGTASTQEVPVEIPAAYEPFHRQLHPTVHLLDGGRIVITASYSADENLVAATGQSRVDLGLDLFYPMPRPLVVVSLDSVTWTQLETPPDYVVFVTTATGGLVASTGPMFTGSFDRIISVSTDGATWEPVTDPETGAPLQGGGLHSAPGHTFYFRQDPNRIWEITIDGARLIAGAGAAPEPLELFEESFHFGELVAGGAGMAFVSAVDDEARAATGRGTPLPDGPGIRYSIDDGATWAFEPFPDELGMSYPGELSVGASQLLLFRLGPGEDDGTLWVRDFPS